MECKITCFKLNWYDCGLTCADNIVQEEVTIYRNDNYMVIKELNGYGVICSSEIIHIDNDRNHEFFEFLEKNCKNWVEDYSVRVCDGSAWKIRMWHSSHKVTKICGTVKYPTNGRKIEKFIRSFLMRGKNNIVPVLFGCGS